MTTMQAAVFHGPHDVRVEEIPKPTEIGPDEILVKVERTAICGTDLHPYEGRMEMEPEVVLGHEFLGTVEEAGPAVTQVTEGDQVTCACVVSCGGCYFCRRNQPGRCIGMRMFGMGMALGDLQGAQADYVVVPWADRSIRKLEPDFVESHGDSLLLVGDIITTGYEAVRKAYNPGDTVAVVGVGPVGMCAVMAARALGAGQVIAIDTVADRLSQALEMGADVAVNAETDDPLDAVAELTEWRGADIVVDAVGHPDALRAACPLVRAGGTLSIPGAYVEDSIELPFGELWLKGVTIQMGVANVITYMDEVIALIAQGRLDPSATISHHMPLSQATEAYKLFESREATKIVLAPGS